MKEDPLSRPPGAESTSFPASEKKPAPSLLGILKNALGAKSSGTLEEGMAELLNVYDPDGTRVKAEERHILHNICTVGETTLEDVMVPRGDVVAVSSQADAAELGRAIVEKGHTRIPVYDGDLDNIVGFIHAKDVVRRMFSDQGIVVKEMTRKILFAPPSVKILDMLLRMRTEQVHIAVVLDEYGGTDGLVTLENIIEEIVGKIEDEHDAPRADEKDWRQAEDGYIISARMPITEVEKKFDVEFPESGEEYDTVGGLLAYTLGRVPKTGETVSHDSGLRFSIKEADPRRIKSVKVAAV